MIIKQLDEIIETHQGRQDSIDMPECFGEYHKKNKLCIKYCAVAMKCCIQKSKNPNMDILERLLIQNHYAAKLH